MGMGKNMKKTREEHIKNCKENAYKQKEFDTSGKEYSDPDRAVINACTTMLVDMGKLQKPKKLRNLL